MPVKNVYLDSSIRKEDITLIVGKTVLLKIIEDSDKQALLKDRVVKSLVSIPNLCYDQNRLLIEELINEETFITAPHLARSLANFSERVHSDRNLSEALVSFGACLRNTFESSKFYKSFEKEMSETAERTFEKMPKKEQEEFRLHFMRRIVGAIDEKFMNEVNKKMISIGEKLKAQTGFDILIPSSLLLCPKCKVVLSTEEFRGSKKCYVCNKKITRRSAKRIYINKVYDKVKKMWEKNLWFEAYIARLLRRYKYKTWIGVHVMGASGILHEIDVLAIRKGIVLVCECKTGKVSRNDVFNFWAKVSDLKAHVSILALIGELPESETREFVKKNPAIIRLENMGKKKEVDILTDLEQRLKIKAEP